MLLFVCFYLATCYVVNRMIKLIGMLRIDQYGPICASLHKVAKFIQEQDIC